ncbi:MAG: PA2778 family cysteine peptidase [Desulfovermiculus sp.]|nr:PA2778 family cysteine peptidase [Desulfovermiculus sp.]
MVRIRVYTCCVLMCCLGCASHALHTQPVWEPKPKSVKIQNVPAYAQEEHQCGAAALASLLYWSGIHISPEELVYQVYDPQRKGTLQSSLLSTARRQGRVAYPIQGFETLQKELRAGHPVLVLLNKGLNWWPVWHYAVVCGFEGPHPTIIMAGGKPNKEKISWSIFHQMWLRADEWGLLVLSPEDLPATASAQEWLRAVHGLELAGQYEQALTGYAVALQRWPFDLAAMMGMANSLYALNRLTEAEKTLCQAVKMHPDSGPAFNNLAQVLLEQGKPQAAHKAINTALELGGPYTESFQETRTAIINREKHDKNP